jgi:hypothetical protein
MVTAAVVVVGIVAFAVREDQEHEENQANCPVSSSDGHGVLFLLLLLLLLLMVLTLLTGAFGLLLCS